jgi:hypothetical protein
MRTLMGSTVMTSKMLLDLARTVSNLNSMIGLTMSKNSLILTPSSCGNTYEEYYTTSLVCPDYESLACQQTLLNVMKGKLRSLKGAQRMWQVLSHTLAFACHCEKILYFVAAHEKCNILLGVEQPLYTCEMSGELSAE